jgi:plasmid stabilization system protein ParE
MKVVWTDEALGEIFSIVDYIVVDNRQAATALADRILYSTETLLSDNPKLGRPGRVENTRELVVHHSYIVAYCFKNDTVEILTVRHAARLWPEIL